MFAEIDSAVVLLYGEFGVPADRLLTEPKHGDGFVDALRGRVNIALPDKSLVLKRVLTLRKKGKLPRLERSYRGRQIS